MNGLFDSARVAFLKGEINWLKDTIRAVLCTGQPSLDRFATLSELKGMTIATSPPFKNKEVHDNGAASASMITFDKVEGERAKSIIVYQDTGDEKTSRLIAYVDKLGRGTFPFTPNGGDVQIVWDQGPDKIFRL